MSPASIACLILVELIGSFSNSTLGRRRIQCLFLAKLLQKLGVARAVYPETVVVTAGNKSGVELVYKYLFKKLLGSKSHYVGEIQLIKADSGVFKSSFLYNP